MLHDAATQDYMAQQQKLIQQQQSQAYSKDRNKFLQRVGINRKLSIEVHFYFRELDGRRPSAARLEDSDAADFDEQRGLFT